jgi:nucleoside phosphorylase/tetratricopeptide (TPR) repeat protein
MGSPAPAAAGIRDTLAPVDVTVGIVAALWIEGLAMRALIDDLEPMPPVAGDPSHYYVGYLPSSDADRPHRVVVTTMPRDSTRNAAAICTNLIRSFPGIRCVVMTGIAGGVPAPDSPDRHVRLGDIVVATKGLVDISHVRQVDGRTTPRRHVEGMSEEMIRAVQELQGHEFNGQPTWAGWLDVKNRPELSNFARPRPGTDILYVAGRKVPHPRRTLTGHPASLPKVHYAAIASGDVLLRDAARRDELAAEHQIVAVEMEGSGIGVGSVALGRHWFMVRGIADYCDNTGKNDLWHAHASLAAAAYVRAMLAECYPFEVPGGNGGAVAPTPAAARQQARERVPAWRQEIVRALADEPYWQSLANRRMFLTVLRTNLPDLPTFADVAGDAYLDRVLEACAARRGGLWVLEEGFAALPAGSGADVALQVLRDLSLREKLPPESVRELDRLVLGAPGLDVASLWPADGSFRAEYGATPPSLAAAVSSVLARPGRRQHVVVLLGLVERAGRAFGASGDGVRAMECDRLVTRLAGRLGVPVPPSWPPPVRRDEDEVDPRAALADAGSVPQDDNGPDPGTGDSAPEGGSTMSDVGKSTSSVAVALPPGGADLTVENAGTPGSSPIRGPRGNTPAVWGNVPPRNPHFIGRERLLDQLHDRLRETDVAAVLPHAIHGMGGVGKSQLAIEYVYRHQSEYDVIWWIPAEKPQQVLSALTELAQQLALPVGPEANTAVPAVKEALRRGTPYANWLLIFDNAEDLQTVQNAVPTGGSGKVLVTSRNADWVLQAETLEVDVFSRDESIRLLRRRDPDISDAAANRLAEALGDLPLAIEQAAAWRAVTGMAATEYLDLLRERADLLGATASPGYETSVAAAWDVSLERLEETSPAAMRLLEVCAFFAPEPITRELFTNAALSGSGEAVDDFEDALQDPIKLNKAIRDLQRYSLAKINHRTNTIELHRLVQAVVVARVQPERQDVVRHRGHRLLAAANPRSPYNAAHWDRYQDLISHVIESDAVECRDPRVRGLVFDVVRYLYQWGDHDGCERLARRVHSAWSRNLGDSDYETLNIEKYLGFILWVNGKYEEAWKLRQATLERYERSADPDDEELADAKLQVAQSLKAAGRYDEAVAICREAHAGLWRTIGEDEPKTLDAAHELAVALRLAGRFVEARDLDAKTVASRSDVLGASHPNTLNTLSGLTIDQRECGDYTGARQHQETVYARCRLELGEFNPGTIRAARYLSVARRKAGDHAGALELSREAERRFRERYRDDHPDAVASAMNLAVDLRQNGDLRGAKEIGERTLQIYERVFGDRHPFSLSARVNLAITVRLLNDPAAAQRLDAEALDVLRETLGPDHPLSLITATNLASDYYALHDYDAAFELDTDTLDRSRRQQGDDHPSTLACNANLALDLRAMGRVGEANAVHKDVVARYRRLLGDGHPATVAASRHVRADCDIDPMPI